MTIETLEISGFRSALEALRLPYGLECRSHSKVDFLDYNKFEKLLGDPSPERRIDIATYTELDERDVKLLSALVQRGPEHSKCIRGINAYTKITAPIYWWCEMETYTVGHYRLASESTMHIDCKGLSGEELVKAKSEIPMGKELTKVDVFNYQNLRNIYFQRRDHRLPEWHTFCEWIERLPYAQEFILIDSPKNFN